MGLLEGDTRSLDYGSYGGVPKCGVTFLGVPKTMTVVF